MAQQFPFMRLPLELRLCVYEQITIYQVQKKIILRPSLLDSVTDPTARPPALVTRNGKEQSARRETDVVLHISAVPVGILGTCRQVNQEVTPFINRLKKDIFRSGVTIDCHWNRPELTYYCPLIVPSIGPQLTNKLLHERVEAAFPGSDAFSQRAIC
ncbi:hypothetical protein GRF29_185g1255649 [Pseudopithomyces chartarum]|uniref:Uncharacterized protein n=1 Tax=Pseudopithomyces chartarum TaxID=1892770 RepID=A0AAN6LR16_9PLEO|nr:hypothetical protein GRF29_185g1255649 [Pseudopithomyces chartarum]